MGLIPGSGRSPGEGNASPLQYSCLENPRQRSLACYSPWGHKESDKTEHRHSDKKKKKLLCKDLKNLNYTLKQPKEEITVEISNIRNILYENHGMQLKYCVSSVQFSGSDVSDSLRPHESQHARPACPSPTPGVHSDSRPSSQ